MKIYLLHAEGCHVNKNNEGTLCELMIFFCFGCGVSTSARNLLKYFSRQLQKLTDAGNLPCG